MSCRLLRAFASPRLASWACCCFCLVCFFPWSPRGLCVWPRLPRLRQVFGHSLRPAGPYAARSPPFPVAITCGAPSFASANRSMPNPALGSDSFTAAPLLCDPRWSFLCRILSWVLIRPVALVLPPCSIPLFSLAIARHLPGPRCLRTCLPRLQSSPLHYAALLLVGACWHVACEDHWRWPAG